MSSTTHAAAGGCCDDLQSTGVPSPWEHREKYLSIARCLPQNTETIPVTAAGGRVAAAPAVAKLPIPPWTNSAMDGFLLRREDVTSVPFTLPVVGDVAAGCPPQPVPAGAALRIMTGAPIAEDDADRVRVIPVENTTTPPGPVPLPESVTITQDPGQKTHIRRAGENISPDDPVLAAGDVIDAGRLATLISAGITHVTVAAHPRVAVISTGDELVAVGSRCQPGQIPDSNAPMIATLARQVTPLVDMYHFGDTAGDVTDTIAELVNNYDVIVTTGGVSAGAFDPVKEALHKQLWFGKIAMQPGKPQGVGVVDSTLIACLPGNPVSAWVSFHLFVAPALQVLAGHQVGKVTILDYVGPELNQQPRGRDLFLPARRQLDGTTAPTHDRFGSHFIAVLGGANSLIYLPATSTADSPAAFVIPLRSALLD